MLYVPAASSQQSGPRPPIPILQPADIQAGLACAADREQHEVPVAVDVKLRLDEKLSRCRRFRDLLQG
jgi:hypothetical protein